MIVKSWRIMTTQAMQTMYSRTEYSLVWHDGWSLVDVDDILALVEEPFKMG
jgi:hypothetical protein